MDGDELTRFTKSMTADRAALMGVLGLDRAGELVIKRKGLRERRIVDGASPVERGKSPHSSSTGWRMVSGDVLIGPHGIVRNWLGLLDAP